jgi:glycerol-3-phosphate dehydrogenase
MRRTITVVGSGVAGSAIAHELVRTCDVWLLYPKADEGASFTNHKWHHSGLLYSDPIILKKAWQAHQRAHPLLVAHADTTHAPVRFLALRKDTVDRRRECLKASGVQGLAWHELPASALEFAEFPAVVGGFHGPDRAVDFPALVHELRSNVKAAGGNVVEGARVTKHLFDRQSRRIQGVIYQLDGRERELISDHTVLAAGAWSIDLLQQTGDLRLQEFVRKVVRKKCVILSYAKEYVKGITVCLDVPKRDGSLGDTTLVPFNGATWAAGTSWMPLGDMNIDNVKATDEEIAALREELAHWCPEVARAEAVAHVCIKTEPDTGAGPPNLLPTVYGGAAHGVADLTLALPGKASFMFELALTVAATVSP